MERLSSRTFNFARLLGLIVLTIVPVPLHAVVLDWDLISTSPSAPAAGRSTNISYECDSSHAGTDVKLTLANTVGTWGSGYPVVSVNNYNGGYTTQKSLAFNFTKESSVNTGLTVTLDFSSYANGVNNVSFQIFDVDFDASGSQWIDKIDQIWATTEFGGTIIGPTSVTGTTYNQVTGSGTTFAVTGVTGNAGANSPLGNVSISFGDTPVTSVQFRWRNTDSTRGDQKIALGDVTYQVASPEVGSSVGAMGVCAMGAAVWWLRRFKEPCV